MNRILLLLGTFSFLVLIGLVTVFGGLLILLFSPLLAIYGAIKPQEVENIIKVGREYKW